MQQAIEQELARLSGRWACVVIRMHGSTPQELVSLNPTLLFPAASLAKVPILIEVARQVEQGMLSWHTRYTLPDPVRASSSGVIADLSPALQPTLHDLAHLMITISDNTAANMLLHLVGFAAVNATMQQLGLQATRLERRFMDFAARQQGRDNWTTAGDMADLFFRLCSHSLPGSQDMLKILLHQNDYTLLPAYWGEDLPFAHKTGDLPGVTHDAGILFPPLAHISAKNAPLIIAVLTSEQVDQPFTRYVLARIGKLIYQPSL
jgi:beta-lactamase class A